MGAVESATMIVAVVMMFAAVGARIMTAQLIGHMKGRINRVAHVRQEAVGRLKQAEGRKSLAEQNKAKLLTRKNKLAKQLAKIREEMAKTAEEDEARRARTELRRVE